jgi:hypothetical protein
MANELPFDLANGEDADATQVMANLNYLLTLIGQGGLGQGGFPALANAPALPFVGQVYFDTTLGYPRVWSTDGTWHGLQLS